MQLGIFAKAFPGKWLTRAIINAAYHSHRIVLAADGGIREGTLPLLRGAGAETVVLIANLLHLYSPEAIAIGGGMSCNLEILRLGICAKVKETAMKGFENIPIIPCALGGNSCLIGAVSLVFDARPVRDASQRSGAFHTK